MSTPENHSPAPTPRPWHVAREYAEQFQDTSVVEAYPLRPAYPDELFSLLAGLCDGACRRVLDAGCGTGEVARRLAPLVEHVDAVDLSLGMIAKGQTLPGGDAPNLRWIEGEVETVALSPLYGLITAASSLHWMEWSVVLLRFARMLTQNGVLAVVFEHASLSSDVGAGLGRLIRQSLEKRGIPLMGPFDLIEELVRRNLFTVLGEQETQPVEQEQSIEDAVGSIHARNGFSRDRMGAAAADRFDARATRLLSRAYPAGKTVMSVRTRVVWGRPYG